MLPDPTRFRNQLDGTPFGPANCTAASAAMALDAYTHGAIVVSPDDIRRHQSDQSGGISLDDAAEAWAHYGLKLDYSREPWPVIVARLAAGDGVIVQGDYDRVGAYSSQRSFLDGHSVYASRLAGDAAVVVFDPLAPHSRVWPLAILKSFYLASTAYQAGWGRGVYSPPVKATHKTITTRVRIRTAPNTSGSIVLTLPRAGQVARIEEVVTGSWYRLSNGSRSNRWVKLTARLGRRLTPPLYSAALLWRPL